MADILIRNAQTYVREDFTPADILILDGKIAEVGSDISNPRQVPELDAAGKKAVPGFLDIHTHGGNGIDVNAADSEQLAQLASFFASQGTTSWLASILTDTKEKTTWCIQQVVAAMAQPVEGARLVGVHLEGPFLCSAYKGAMPEHLLLDADGQLLQAYQQAAQGAIRYLTVSPEVPGVVELVAQATALGIRVAVGHTGADYDTTWQCIGQGAVAATHTFNAMQMMHHHAPGVVGAVLESDIYCEAICDGRHLHPATVRLLLKIKGADRVVAVTDSIMAAGLPDGNYMLGVNPVVVKDGDARLAQGDARAGSTLTAQTGLRNLIEFTGWPLEKVLPLLTENPARLLGIFEQKGSLAPGKDGDVVLLDENIQVCSTIVGGKLVYSGR